MPRAAKRAASCAFVVASFVVAREASAAGGAKWYVEAETSCDAEPSALESLEREIGLACAAVGGTCRVVATPDEAELRATLACHGESWSLETRTIEGSPLNKIDLGGPSEDRLREAAIEVARDVAPERSLVIDSLNNAMPGTDAGARPREAARPTMVSVAASGRGTISNDGAAPTGGARLLGGYRVGSLTYWSLSGSYELGGEGDRAHRDLRVGTGVVFGAPLHQGLVGAVVEGGAIVDESRRPDVEPGRWGLVAYPRTRIGAFGQATFVVQYPEGPIRPYAGIAGAAMTIPPTFATSAELGLAFAVF